MIQRLFCRPAVIAVSILGCALLTGDSCQQFRIHKENRIPLFRGKQRNATGVGNAWPIVKPGTRGEENEPQDNAYHHVVLPTGTWKIPQDEALEHRPEYSNRLAAAGSIPGDC